MRSDRGRPVEFLGVEGNRRSDQALGSGFGDQRDGTKACMGAYAVAVDPIDHRLVQAHLLNGAIAIEFGELITLRLDDRARYLGLFVLPGLNQHFEEGNFLVEAEAENPVPIDPEQKIR